MILDKKPKQLLNEFLKDYSQVHSINIDKSLELIAETFKFYKNNGNLPGSYARKLQDLWYQSLKEGKINYNLYNEKYYFTDLWTCWIYYSRKYLVSVTKYLKHFNGCNSVIDLGCGIGLTTIALSEMFPTANTYGFNLKDTDQYKFCEKQTEKYNFKMISDLKQIQQVDIVFASEYFEHILRPIEHLKQVIVTLRPKAFIIANSFNTIGLGHFPMYRDGNTTIMSNLISRRFNKTLRTYGYEQLKTKIWNNKPSIWIKPFNK